jgi:carboxyl-terminal processing protease
MRYRNIDVGTRPLIATGLACLVIIFGGFVKVPDGDYFFKVNKGIELFGRVYKEIAANYVDVVDPERFVQAGIDGMLESLDPYTVYIDKENGDEVDLLTNGKYGGVGITISQREGRIEVISVMEGYSGARQGLLPGDRIVEIDGHDVRTKRPDEVRSLTRGEPGTEVKVAVEREGESAPLTFVLIREEIQVKNVTFADFVDPGIGYIKLERFSRKAGDEVRQAIKELKIKGDVKAIVLDVRGNPGGLLDAAVDVVSKFVLKGSHIVTTKGRRSEGDKEYTSPEEPLLPNVHLAVLTDRGSASASEIVSGAIQDLDRGLIIGDRTFGKGLVQTILPLNYGAQLKVTTARYYIPSGRSIQEIDYKQKDRNGIFASMSDSLRHEFKTLGGRSVYEHGGITPDSSVTVDDTGPMVKELNRKALFFRFANQYVTAHHPDSISGIDQAMLDEFKEFLKEKQFDYQEDAENQLATVQEIAERSHYSAESLHQIDILKTSLTKEKERGFERYRQPISRALEVEMMARLQGDQGRIKRSLRYDPQLKTAVALVKNDKLYNKLLGF